MVTTISPACSRNPRLDAQEQRQSSSHRGAQPTRRRAHASWLYLFSLVFLLAVVGCSGQVGSYPESARLAVTDEYHGTEVTEEYRWLEDFEDPEVKSWSDAQNQFARAYLDGIAEREAIQAELTELYSEGYVSYYSLRQQNGVLFAMKSQPPHEQAFLVTLGSAHDTETERILLDLNELDTTFSTAIDFYVPSRNADKVAVSLSQKGSEKGTVYIYDVATGERLVDKVPGVNGPTAGGSVAWNRAGTGFYYTRYPRPGERPDEDLSFYHQVYYHKLGTFTEEDTYAIGEEFPRIAEIDLATSKDGRYVLAAVANGDGGEYAHYLLEPKGEWRQVTRFSDGVNWVRFGPDGNLYLYSHKNAPRGQILQLPLSNPELAAAKVVVPESDVTIRSFLPTRSKLYLVDLVGGPSQMRVVDLKRGEVTSLPVPPISSIRGLTALDGDRILFRTSSYSNPSAWYEYDPVANEATKTALVVTSKADYTQVEVVREFATSKDGTKIPMSILRPKGMTLDGQNPTVLYGYGGYGISLTPGFDADKSIWLKQGGVYVIANLRGGGEFGEAWHLAGNLTNKQNVFDDFAACAEYLIEAGYTNPSRLAIEGGSNGGLLMGAALTQRPDLYRAVVAHVGIYDMLRVELDPNGEFNVTEFGTVKDRDQFKALHAYSPYHQVKENAPYPAVLFLTGQHDGRVNPAHSRKMTAHLQAATRGASNPILLRTSARTGHGRGTSLTDRIARDADVYAFLFRELGLSYKDRPVAGQTGS